MEISDVRSNLSDVTSDHEALPGVLSDALYRHMGNAVLGFGLIAGVFAVEANILTIIVYIKMGFFDSTNISLAALAISDFGVGITTISTALICLLAPLSSVPFSRYIVIPLSTYPHTLLARISALITTYISVERYLCVLLPLRIKTIITRKRTFIAMVILFGVTLLNYPVAYLRYPLGFKFDSKRNKTLFNLLPVTDQTFLFMTHIRTLIIHLMVPFVTFFVVLLCTILLSLNLQRNKAWRDANKYNPLKSRTKAANESESEARQSKEIRAIKMVITIATVFIVTSIPACTQMVFMLAVPEFSESGRYYKLFDVIGMFYLAVNSINSGVNVIIYFTMSQKFKQATLLLFRI